MVVEQRRERAVGRAVLLATATFAIIGCIGAQAAEPSSATGVGARALPVDTAAAWAETAAASTLVARGESRARTPWLWPAAPPRSVVRSYEAPTHRYGPGHRGIDIAAVGALVSPADGTVAFAGTVVDRPVITIAHADGLVTTLEPVDSPLAPGSRVRAGDVIGSVSSGGHAAAGTVHFGVRLDGEYVNPLQFFQSGRRAILLPCC